MGAIPEDSPWEITDSPSFRLSRIFPLLKSSQQSGIVESLVLLNSMSDNGERNLQNNSALLSAAPSCEISSLRRTNDSRFEHYGKIVSWKCMS